VVCDTKIYAKPRIDSVTCDCLPSFSWKSNVGCTCTDPNAFIVGTGALATCITCDSNINANGIDTKKKLTCLCLGSLIWQTKTCGCQAGFAISTKDGVYSCVACVAKVNAKKKINNDAC